MGQGFDTPRSARVLSLAHALKRSKRLRLAGIFDIRRGRAAAAEDKWGCPPSPRAREAWLDSGWDVVIIATPAASHPRDLRDVLARRPRAVLVEKPVAADGHEAVRLLEQARAARVPVMVDFPRRGHTGVEKISRWFADGVLGRALEVRGRYSGGLANNGIHLLDVVAAWCGPTSRVRRVLARPGHAWLDYRAPAGPVALFLAEAPQTGCYVWELTCDTREARIELGGYPETLRVYRRQPHAVYPRYRVLAEDRRWTMDDEPLLLRAVERLASLATDAAAGEAHLRCEIERHRFFRAVLDRTSPLNGSRP
jgi:predicted dehydrogenase